MPDPSAPPKGMGNWIDVRLKSRRDLLVFSVLRVVVVLSLLRSAAFAETVHWEPGKIIAVEAVTTPPKTPDPDCRLPRGATVPAHCRAANLRAEQFWRVTVESGNKRYVVRPYRAPKFLDSLNQEGPVYVDPNLTAGSTVEVAIYANNSVRLRTDKGDGIAAIVDNENAIAQPQAALKVEAPPVLRAIAVAPAGVPIVPSGSKVVLLENGDFIDLEAQQLKAQDIGDGAVLYSFPGVSSPARIGSSKPVFLVMVQGNLELARMQVGNGSRQLLFSAAKKHSASSLAISVTQVSDTIRRVTLNEPLAPGEYVFVMEDSNRAFLFEAR